MPEEFECEICKKKFDAEVSLNQHKNAKHDANLPLVFTSSKIVSSQNTKFSLKLSKKTLTIILVIVSIPVGYFIFNLFGSSSTAHTVAYSPLNQHGEHALGSLDAPVKIVEFGDFQCPFCRRFTLDTEPSLRKNYIDTGKVRLVFKQFIGHTLTEKTAEAAECANDQGKYWEYHDKLFETQDAWQYRRNLDGELISYAEELGLNSTLFKECLDSGIFKDVAKKEMREARNSGVSGTPTFFINGKRAVGAQPYHVFARLIDSEINQLAN